MTAERVLDSLKEYRERLAAAADGGYRLAAPAAADELPDEVRAYLADLGFRLIQAQAKVTEIESILVWWLATRDKATAQRFGSKLESIERAVESVEGLVEKGIGGRWKLPSSAFKKRVK